MSGDDLPQVSCERKHLFVSQISMLDESIKQLKAEVSLSLVQLQCRYRFITMAVCVAIATVSNRIISS